MALDDGLNGNIFHVICDEFVISEIFSIWQENKVITLGIVAAGSMKANICRLVFVRESSKFSVKKKTKRKTERVNMINGNQSQVSLYMYIVLVHHCSSAVESM